MTDFDSCYAMRKGKLVLRGIVNHTQRNDTAPYLTGGVYTKGKKAFTNGRIEICAKLNAAGGAWPAIWMLPEGAAWPSGGEIDIMERLNNDSIAYQTVHSHYTYTLGIKDHPVSHSTGVIHPDRYNILQSKCIRTVFHFMSMMYIRLLTPAYKRKKKDNSLLLSPFIC